MKALLPRLQKDGTTQTLGRFYLYDGIKEVFSCVVLELGDNGNKTGISSIPAKTYKCELRWSEKYQWHFWVKDVEGRDWILIHFGNYFRDTRGCILLGNAFADINKDGYLDVTSSKKTIKRLLEVAPKEFDLTILDLDAT